MLSGNTCKAHGLPSAIPRVGFDGKDFRPGVLIGTAYTENNKQLVRLNAARLGERIAGDQILELGGCAYDHRRTEAKGSLDRVLRFVWPSEYFLKPAVPGEYVPK